MKFTTYEVGKELDLSERALVLARRLERRYLRIVRAS